MSPLTPLLVAAMSLLTPTAAPADAAPPAASTAPDGPSLPPVQRRTLPNGLTVLLIENHANPFVEAHLVFRAGSASDPAGQEGLASMTALMLVNGTATRTEDQIADALDDMGAQLGASAGFDSLEVSGSVTTLEPKDLATFLGLFRDVVRDATFPQASLDKHRTLRLSAIERVADDHGSLADLAFDAALYQGQPAGRPVMGYLSTLPGLTRADLVDFRDRVLIPQHAVLALAGDFDATETQRWIDEAFGDPEWGAGVCAPGDIDGRCARLCLAARCLSNPLATKPTPAGPSPAKRRVVLVDRDDPSIHQIHFRLGADNPVTNLDPRWGAFRLGTQILGGDFTSRLNQVLRVREGLTYGARFHVDFKAYDSGAMNVSTYVAPKDLGKAIDLTLGEIETVRAAALPAEEIDGFKAKIVNAFPFKFETVSDTLAQYLYMEAGGVPVSWLRNYTDAVSRPSASLVHTAMQLVDPSRMVLVAVGNRDLVEVLATYGEVEIIDAKALVMGGFEDALRAAAATTADDDGDGETDVPGSAR